MYQFKNSYVARGGKAGGRLEAETKKINTWRNLGSATLNISFGLSSAGGGETNVRLCVEKEDFEGVLATMMECDRTATVAAIGNILKKLADDGWLMRQP